MRDFKGMKRQRGRNRSGGGGGGGNNKQPHNVNRAFDSNGPDNVKIRGHAQHVYEKYQQLARDAAAASDRVLAENYLQHAEHYFRLLRTLQPNRPPSEIMGRDAFASGYDIDFEDESGQDFSEGAPAEGQPAEPSAEGGQGDGQQQNNGGQGGGQNGGGEYRQRDDRDRDRPRDRDRNFDRDRDRNRNFDRPRDDRPRDDRPRDDRPRDDRPRDDRPRDDRPRDDRPRDDRPRDERPREDRPPREERNFDRDRPRDRDRDRDRPRDDRPPREERTPAAVESESEPDRAGMLRSQDGEMSHAPAFLSAPSPGSGAAPEGEAKKPRTRARKKPAGFDKAEGGED